MLVLGVSAGAGGARGVLTAPDRPHHEPVARCDVRRRTGAEIGEAVISVIRTLRAAAVDRSEMVAATAVTLRTGIDPEAVYDASAAQSRHHVRVVPETSSQLRYLRFTGLIPRHGASVLYDVGSSGLSACVADAASGEVLVARRSAVVGGDQFDRSLQAYLFDQGFRLDLTECRDLKEQLGHERVATATDPDTGACRVLTGSDLAALTRDAVAHSTSVLRSMIRESKVRPSRIVVLGGGARVPGLVATLQSELRIQTVVPPEPASVAGRGAVLLAAATAAPAARPGPAFAGW
ncbi:hypothetical protein [Rhodococcus daqingensis]|uniref:Molecular chaperone n=1 Tax=Rhodococcus daqingensis TaxID=2479363 RepID=A0ABW2S0K8_9NOCA